MQQNKESTNTDNGAYKPCDKEMKTTCFRTSELSRSYSLDKNKNDEDVKKKSTWYNTPAAETSIHFLTIFLLGIGTWGILWCTFGEGWRWDGSWFRLAIVAVVGWGSGQLLHATTTLPPLLAALLTGIFARHFNILDMRQFTHIDALFRRIYPVVILGKASLGWDLNFMKKNWRQVSALGVLPWTAEVITLATCTNLILGFPWVWGLLLGSIYASVSCAVVMPSVQKAGAGAGAPPRNWVQLVCTAGGTDTALSVGVYGLIFSYMFVEADDVYRYAKAALTLFAGVALGVACGGVASVVPHARDYYVTEMRVLVVLVSGLLSNFVTSLVGWGGTGGVAVLVCNATAASRWARDGWKLNNNAASTAYRVMWATLEPILFAYTGTFFVMNTATLRTVLYGLAILLVCLTVRLTVTALVCWDMTFKERLFMCCAWTPKSIVEAVLCPTAINSLMMSAGPHSDHDMALAEDLIRLIVPAILITTPIGFLLSKHLGPTLLRKPQKDSESECGA